jgi:hypothetical protein
MFISSVAYAHIDEIKNRVRMFGITAPNPIINNAQLEFNVLAKHVNLRVYDAVGKAGKDPD